MNRKRVNIGGRFVPNEGGAVSIMVALSLPVLMLMVGGAMDYARKNDVRYKLQSATDAALLEAMIYRRDHPKATAADMQRVFSTALNARFQDRLQKKRIILKSLQLNVDAKGKASATVNAEMRTSFLRLAAINALPMQIISEAQASTARTEVALVLDITGSMGWNGKLDELKRAVRSFLDNIYNKMKNAPAENFKVAVVPFSKYVNVGMDKRNALWMQVYPDGWRRHRGWRPLYVKWEGCVGSRPYPYNIRDDSYALNPIPGVMNYRRDPRYSANDRWGWWVNPRTGRGIQRCQQNEIIPLKSVKTHKSYIINKVNSFQASGWTYIPAGLAWGWRVLSHDAPYTEGASDNDVQKYNVQKIIVLMTDGANTVAPYRDRRFAYHDHGSNSPSYADQITRELCNNIKAKNPRTGKRNAEIITITFDVSSQRIKNLMENCASLASFDVRKGQLESVFDSIAAKLVDLHLSR